MYNKIFVENLNRILKQKGISKFHLHELSGVSASIISDITRGNGNPTLSTMSSIADALGISLPELLISSDGKSDTPNKTHVPDGCELVTAVLPSFKAFQVRQWSISSPK